MVQQIRDTRPTAPVSVTVAKKTDDSKAAFDVDVKRQDEVSGSTSLQSSSISLGNIDPLFLTLENDGNDYRQAYEYADQILNELSLLQQGFLDGHVLKTNLEELSRFSRNFSDRHIPDGLKDILVEIETRAAVELAKLNKASK